MTIRVILSIAALVIVYALSSTPAQADAIDGYWCSPDGRSLFIDGPLIVTPGGKSMKGDYDRHGFRYTVPKQEQGAGSIIDMNLIDDDTVQYQASAADAKSELWQRCSKPVS